jgi:hypothetical protein
VFVAFWIASRSLSSGAHSRDPLARNDGNTTHRQPGYSMLTLYFAPGSSSMAVHIALHEISVAFDGRPPGSNWPSWIIS